MPKSRARKARTRTFMRLSFSERKLAIFKAAKKNRLGRDVIRPVFEKVKEEILDNAERRYLSMFRGVGSRSGVNILQAMRSSTQLRITRNTVTIGIANKDQMDRATRLPPTKSEGKVYSLWSLLREGWGREGGKRADDYILLIYSPEGSIPPYPDMVRRIESEGHSVGKDRYIYNGIFNLFVRHPGMRGRDWLTVVGKPYDEDAELVSKGIKRVIRSVGRSFNKGVTLKVVQ